MSVLLFHLKWCNSPWNELEITWWPSPGVSVSGSFSGPWPSHLLWLPSCCTASVDTAVWPRRGTEPGVDFPGPLRVQGPGGVPRSFKTARLTLPPEIWLGPQTRSLGKQNKTAVLIVKREFCQRTRRTHELSGEVGGRVAPATGAGVAGSVFVSRYRPGNRQSISVSLLKKKRKEWSVATLCFGWTAWAGGGSYHHSREAAQIYGIQEPNFMWIIWLFRNILLFFFINATVLFACTCKILTRASYLSQCSYINTFLYVQYDQCINIWTTLLRAYSQFCSCATYWFI